MASILYATVARASDVGHFLPFDILTRIDSEVGTLIPETPFWPTSSVPSSSTT